jgi:hypothetical protein
MIKRSVVERIGMLDEKLFIYYEEYDWSIRIQQAGYSILFVPGSEILHKESMTLTKDSPFRTKTDGAQQTLAQQKISAVLPTYALRRLRLVLLAPSEHRPLHISEKIRSCKSSLYRLIGRYLLITP